MTNAVVDSSVVLAIIRGEPGEKKAARLSASALMSAVNLAEVVTKCIEQNYPEEIALQVIRSIGLRVIEFDFDHAVLAGQLRAAAPKGVLSLGDRACIATAIRAGATAVTADRAWAALELPCPVELIR